VEFCEVLIEIGDPDDPGAGELDCSGELAVACPIVDDATGHPEPLRDGRELDVFGVHATSLAVGEQHRCIVGGEAFGPVCSRTRCVLRTSRESIAKNTPSVEG
jgi:hypothetical protein